MALSLAKVLSKFLPEKEDLSEFRYERKFLVTCLTEHELESFVKINPGMFSEIYYPRWINNIYLDSPNMENYYENVDGLNNRVKARIRWYGELFGEVKNPVLEFKIKNGLLGRKESFNLKDFKMDNDFNLATLHKVIEESNLDESLKIQLRSLDFALLNRYHRKYFKSACANFRITIDKDLSYYKLNHMSNNFVQDIHDTDSLVLELKYTHDKDNIADKITDYFPFRMTKNSKYVNGVDYLNYQ